eukprot:PhF_6_TR40884/c0_g1_i1/m.61830
MSIHGVAVPFVCMIFFTSLTAATTWSVLCRSGQPPMNDFITTTQHTDVNDSTLVEYFPNGTCTGLFYEIFTVAMDRTQFTYTITGIEGDVTQVLSKSTSPYHVAIAFSTITPDRFSGHDFSSTIMQTKDMFILQPSFQRFEASLIASIIRDPVFYLFSIVTLSTGIVAIV